MDTIETIMKRRSYRGRYRPVPVPREDLITIMKAGLAAPSGCNKQTVSLIAVDDPVVLQRLHSVIHPDIAVTAPAAICVLSRKIIAYRDRCFAVQDYGAAVENLLLAAAALGYQSCWYEGHITDEDRINVRMAEILGVPADYELVCFLPVGIGEEEPVQPVKKPFMERAFFNSFGDAGEETIPPKNITQTLNDSLGHYFNVEDEQGESRLPLVSRLFRSAVAVSRSLHLDTDVVTAILFTLEMAETEGGISRACPVLWDLLEEISPAKTAAIHDAVNRLVMGQAKTPEEKLARAFADAGTYAKTLEPESQRRAWLAEYKEKMLTLSHEAGSLVCPDLPPAL
jgi:nitroreductase